MVNKKPVPPAKRAVNVRGEEKLNSFKIEVPKLSRARAAVPGSVFRQAPFTWEPQAFAVEHEKFIDKLVSEAPQRQSVETFLANPGYKGIFGVAGNPDDQMAKYFAAYLVHHHMKTFPHASVHWETVYGGFENKLLKEPKDGISMLVLSNLTVDSTAVKMEKARDLLEYYSNIPRVVVCTGTDPMSFLCCKLYCPINAMVYIQGKALNLQVI